MSTTDRDSRLNLGREGAPLGDASPDEPSSAAQGIWLDGDVLACACPDCGAPMSIRLWLLLADCWRCGASIELSDEQEQQALRLLRQKEQARREEIRQAGLAITPTLLRKPTGRPAPGDPVPPGEAVRERTPEVPARIVPPPPPAVAPKPPPSRSTAPGPPLPAAPPRRPTQAAMPTPHGTRARLRKLYEKGAVAFLWSHLLDNLPAWLVSLVVHLVAILLLGLWIVDPSGEPPSITLSTTVGPEDQPGDIGELEESLEALTFEAPGHFEAEVLPADVLGTAEADVKLESLPAIPSEPPGSLPDVKGLFASTAPALRGGMFAGRDPAVRAQLVRRGGGTEYTEAAVARALRWIAQHQNRDGSWSLHAFHRAPGADGTCDGFGGQSDTAGTALGLLPFLGAGQTHLDGEYQDVIRRGLKWLVEHQHENGDLRDGRGFGRMYAHGQAAIVLCEAYAMTGDPQLRRHAQRALDFIVKAQHREGGWRYEPGQAGDTSVVGWQLMAIQSGRMHYLHVPRKTLYLAGQFLDQVEADRTGGLYAYQRGRAASPAMTAEALLCRLYLGWPVDHRGVEIGVDYLLKHLPDKSSPNIYYWYYATQVMHHVGGDAWPKWNARMRATLVDMQETEGHAAGSWDPRGGFADRGGRLYMTSLAACILEVYYRHMPLNRTESLHEVGHPTGLEEPH